MKSFLKFLMIDAIVLGCSQIISAEIITIQSMHAIPTQVDKVLTQGKNLLLAFDIDMTLTRPSHSAIAPVTRAKYTNEYQAIVGNFFETHSELFRTLSIDLPSCLVEPHTSEIIQNIQKKGIKIIAFTAGLTGEREHNSITFEERRYQNLLRLGIQFDKSFPQEERILFTECESYRNQYPVFYRGILFSNAKKGETTDSKGRVMVVFLKRLKLTPQVIIMVDDKKKNLKNIDTFLKNYDSTIQFIGIEYQGILHHPPEEITLEDFRHFWVHFLNQAQFHLIIK